MRYAVLSLIQNEGFTLPVFPWRLKVLSALVGWGFFGLFVCVWFFQIILGI